MSNSVDKVKALGRAELFQGVDAHTLSQMSAWNTSEQRRPIACSAGTPVIRSAALLNEVIRQLQSTVNTPSATQRNTVSKN